jgi:hypothetical protein
MKWVRDVKTQGKKWTLFPPSHEALYPNMCVDSGPWNSPKQKIASELSDITQIWNLGVKHRKKAFLNDIKSWRDPEFRTEKIGVTGARADIIDKIIDINRQEKFKILPKKITSRLYNWNLNSNQVYIDFETICDIFSPMSQIPDQIRTERIFMIGVWYKEPTYSDYYYDTSHVWAYRGFTASSLDIGDEYKIMSEFVDFMKSLHYPKMWYWYADKSIWERAKTRVSQYSTNDNQFHLENWADLCKIFREEPIVIRGVFKFGLKEIANAMYNYGFISTKIPEGVSSGLSASVLAWQAYNKSRDLEKDPFNDPVIKAIEEYNKFDVSVLADIHYYLRLYHL